MNFVEWIRYRKVRKQLTKLVREKKLDVQSHPTLPLNIYKYSRTFQYNGVWDDFMLTMRGAVFNKNGKRINKNLNKFFNYEEQVVLTEQNVVEELAHVAANEPMYIQRKLDGSCVQVFLYNYQPIVTTLGSFKSEQAIAAYDWLAKTHGFDWIAPNRTYVFEWLDPNNFTTLQYKGEPKLVLLTIICQDGDEMITSWPYETEWRGERVREHSFIKDANVSLDKMNELVADDEEGIVLLFRHRRLGQFLRYKIKGERYLELHRTRWGLTEKRIWEREFVGGTHYKPINMKELDEETRAWADSVIARMQQELNDLVTEGYGWLFKTKEYQKAQGGSSSHFHEFVNSQVPKEHRGFVYSLGNSDDPRRLRTYIRMIEPKGVKPRLLTTPTE